MWQPKPAIWAPGIRDGHPLAQGLFEFWAYNEGNGKTLPGSLRRYPITLSYGNRWKTGCLGAYTDHDQAVGAAPVITGSGQRSAMAICRNFSTNEELVRWGTNVTSQMFRTRVDNDGIRWRVEDWDHDLRDLTTGIVVTDGDWHATVATYDGNIARIYTDGRFAGSQTWGAISTATTALVLSRSNVGEIGCAGIWTRALAAGEVEELYSDPWSLIRPRQRTYFPVAASGSGATPVTGTAAQTTPAAQQSASGTETLTGTATQTAPAAQQSASGAQGIAGAAAQTTGSATQSASGAETMSGAAAQEAPESTQTATGTLTISGVGAQSMPGATQVAAGTLTIIGTVVQEAPSATQSASVLLAVPITCTITQTAPAATQAVTGISAVGVLGYAVSMAPAATQILVVVETPPTGEPINGTYDVSATLSGTFDVIEQLAGTY